jgi:catechol 2,3-dioxygenase-like lactoylglutathione lyase family enzyme
VTTTAASSTEAQDLNALKPRVAYVAYHVADIDRALAFYVGVLGLKEQLRMPLGNGEQEVVLAFPENKGAGVILMWNTERKTPYQSGDGYSRIVMTVSDLDAAMALLARHDTRIATPPTDAGPMRYAIALDPDGYSIELLQLKRG